MLSCDRRYPEPVFQVGDRVCVRFGVLIGQLGTVTRLSWLSGCSTVQLDGEEQWFSPASLEHMDVVSWLGELSSEVEQSHDP